MKNTPRSPTIDHLPFLRESNWQMSFGERAAVEGILSQLRPRLSIELGTAQGGSLERIAAYSGKVHTFDLLDSGLSGPLFENVEFHVGDSHALLPKLLQKLAEAGESVDFVLVDGDHSADGVERDLIDLLESSSVERSVIMVHDTANEVVREGIERVHFEAYPKVAYVELDFVAGYLFAEPSLLYELWGGLGLIVLDAARLAYFAPPVRQQRYVPLGPLLPQVRDRLVSEQADA